VLRGRGLPVNIIQRSAQLTNKQLDEVAAEILRDELLYLDIETYLMDQVVMWKGENWIDGPLRRRVIACVT
jgi:NAD(P)H-nitrite reductase large subunit